MVEYTFISSIECILFVELVQLILKYSSDIANSSVSIVSSSCRSSEDYSRTAPVTEVL